LVSPADSLAKDEMNLGYSESMFKAVSPDQNKCTSLILYLLAFELIHASPYKGTTVLRLSFVQAVPSFCQVTCFKYQFTPTIVDPETVLYHCPAE
jgi:hypothetical protein